MIRLTVTKEELWVLLCALHLLNENYPSTDSIYAKLEEELKSIYKEVP